MPEPVDGTRPSDAPPAEAAERAASTRRAGVEYARLLACVGVVWYHAEAPGQWFTPSAMIVLTIASIAFAARVKPGGTMAVRVRERVVRLGMPWVFWWLAYAAAKVAQGVAMGGEDLAPIGWFEPWMLLAGPAPPALHLWWLPFGLSAAALTTVLAYKGLVRPSPTLWGVYTGLAFATVVPSALLFQGAAGVSVLEQWLYTLPAVPAGLAIACIAIDKRGAAAMVAVTTGLLVAGYGLAWALGVSLPFWSYTATALVLTLLWTPRASAPRVIAKLGAMAYGVYLIHMFFVSGIKEVGLLDEGSHALAAASLVLSFVATALMLKTPLKRFL